MRKKLIIWESEGVNISIKDRIICRGVTTAEDIRRYAKEMGFSRYYVKLNGKIVGPEVFPISAGNIEIEEYKQY